MKITETDVKFAKVESVTDLAKSMVWGTAPFPAGMVPILAVTSLGNPLCGILMRVSATGRFVIGTSGALRSLNNNYALELMAKAKVDDTWQCGSWGGAREGAGRPKTIPEEAKRRSIYLTDEEFQAVKEWLALYRDEKESEKEQEQ